MSDKTQPSSGSRWEPTGDRPQAQTTASADSADATPAYAAAAPAARPRRERLLLAGAAAGIALAAGAGGFAIGHATAGDGRDGGPARFGTDADLHGPEGLPGDRDGDGDHGGLPGDNQDYGTDDPSGAEGS